MNVNKNAKPKRCSCGHRAVSADDYYVSSRPTPRYGGICVDCHRTRERARQQSYRGGKSTTALKRAGHGSLREQIKRDPEILAALGVLRDAQAQRGGRQGFIYCIAEKGLHAVKIGYSVKPEARPGELQTGNPRPLRLLGAIKGTRDTERSLHAKYIEQNLVGEWFRPSPELLSEFGI